MVPCDVNSWRTRKDAFFLWTTNVDVRTHTPACREVGGSSVLLQSSILQTTTAEINRFVCTHHQRNTKQPATMPISTASMPSITRELKLVHCYVSPQYAPPFLVHFPPGFGFFVHPAVDRPGEPQLVRAAVREPEGDSAPYPFSRRPVAAGAGRGRESAPGQPAAAGRFAPLQLQEKGTCAYFDSTVGFSRKNL